MAEDSTAVSLNGAASAPSGGVIEPAMAMALNVHAGPGVYALLLGSGVSLASGVKTGWGVAEDLVRKVAAVREPDNPTASQEAMADPEKWWETHDGSPLGYSALLAAAAPCRPPAKSCSRGTSSPSRVTTVTRVPPPRTGRSPSWSSGAASGPS